MMILLLYWVAGAATAYTLTPENREKYGVIVAVAHIIALVAIWLAYGFWIALLAFGVDLLIGLVMFGLEKKT